MDYRIEKDTIGEVKVPANRLWGAQTERSKNNFKIGPSGSIPTEIVYAFAIIKKAAALTNYQKGKFNFNLSAYGYSESEHVLGEELDSYLVVNGSVRYQFSDNITLSLSGLNLADEDYATNTLSNDFTSGLPARGRMGTIGVEYKFY